MTGQEIDYEVFSPGEPNNMDGDEHCMANLKADLVADVPCHTKAVPVCQWPSHDGPDDGEIW